MNNIERQLEEARQNLLDLTMRNRLLNFRPTKARTLRVTDEIPKEVYDILVLKEKSMEFLPKPETPNSHINKEAVQDSPFGRLEEDYSDLTEDEASILWKLPAPDTEVADRHRDRSLQTALESNSLQKRLFYINQESRSVLQEQGYNILYLVLGFLEWTESPSSLESRRAPLILVPVELVRSSVRSSFKLRWIGEDILTNISLKAKLEEQSISLPEFEMPEDANGIDSYFESVLKAIPSMPKWNIMNGIYLDFFSFTKFVMYKDLDMKSWPEGISPEDYPLIKAIFAPSFGYQTHNQGFSEEDVDEKLSLRQCYHVMDADSSQIAVIETVKTGYNLVVEGPPGTGKSQTITNIIAELLALGKSVLFVSEKMAALEVVKSRLDSLGLGDFCLELHSRKSNKREVLKELERTINSPHPKPIYLEDKFDRLETFSSQLNDYARALREPFGALGLSPFRLYGIREKAGRHFAEVGRDILRVRFTDPENFDQNQWSIAKSELSNLQEILPLVKPISTNPWKGCNPGTVLPSDEEENGKLIEECLNALNLLDTAIKRLVESCAVQLPRYLSDVTKSIDAARVIAVSKPIDRSVLLNSEWNKPSEQAEMIINKVELLQSDIGKVLSKFKYKALQSDIKSMLTEYKILSVKFLKFLKRRYRYLKREITSLYNDPAPKKDESKILDLEQLAECISLRNQITELEETSRSLFGSHWQGENSDLKMLRDFSEWIVSYRGQLLREALTKDSIDIVSAGVSREYVEKLIEDVIRLAELFENQHNLLIKRVGADYKVIFGKEANNVPFSKLESLLKSWEIGLPRLHRWAQFIARTDACLNTIARPLIELIESDKVEPEDIVNCFEGNFADDLLRLAFIQRPSLGNFIGDLHEKKIKSFAELDRELIAENRKRLKHKVYQDRPSIIGGVSPGSEVGILLGQTNRKRRHMPIRKLITVCGKLIQKIKPCFMMSPLSIAQFLDPKNISLDVIIFDEASQVKPEDALGALLRGKQIVVMGDTKQLPPTSFFDHIVEINDDEDNDQELETPVADVESILHLCKRSFPAKTLRWHYRSRHESLVAVSNQEFYDNQLTIYPSPIDNSEHLGLKFVYLPDATYDRGRSSVNRKEARAVVEAALEHYRKFPQKSLGIGTFNIKQQQAILEEIEFQLRQNPEMEDFFSSNREEQFFVKNLETIQGDERDVIFLSIGYGFDANKRFSRNFGPLNHEGGHRRLNVLITRARERCVVFSNFRAIDLSIDESSPFGLRALKTFLNYAENRTLASIEPTEEDTDSPFEDSVYDFLRSHDYEVRKQVGCAGFRVDLAIVDSNYPGRYLLGIECDGAKYHSSPVARDRDRLRQQILEGLGWKIYRLWSTDWYRNRSESEKRLLEAIERVKHEEPMSTLHHKPNESVKLEQNKDDTKSKEISSQPDLFQQYFSSNVSDYTETNATGTEETLEDKIQDYEACSSLDLLTYGELHELPVDELSRGVIRVVEIEGPIHFDEVVRRIRSLCGLRRTGQRINTIIQEATSLAEINGKIIRRGDFLWPIFMRKATVRKRSGDPPHKIDFICDEEIAEAIKLVLKYQHATLPHELIIQTSRLLGIQATRSETFSRIESVIEKLKVEGVLQQRPNGMINFAKS
ncbi:MAG: DUF3320 domain-containing protein [Thermodesulfobacteriota bacterium]